MNEQQNRIKQLEDSNKTLEYTLQRYQQFFKLSAEGIHLWQFKEAINLDKSYNEQVDLCLKNMILSDCNQEFASAYGYKGIDQIIGITLVELLQDEDLAKSLIKSLVNKEYRWVNFQTKESDIEGNTLYFRNNIVGEVKDNHLHYLWGTQIDITEQKTTSLELDRQEELFRLAVKAGNDGVWDWRLETNEVYFSKRYMEMLGYGEHELGGSLSTFESLIYHEDAKRVFSHISEFIKGEGETYQTEFRMVHKDGHLVNIMARGFLMRNEYGKVYRVVGTHVDLTERYQIESRLRQQVDENLSLYEEYRTINEELHEKNNDLLAIEEELRANNEELYSTNNLLSESEEKYRALFENMSEAFALYEIVLDEQKNVIDYVTRDANATYLAYMQMTKEQVIGLKHSQMVPEGAHSDESWLNLLKQVAFDGISARIVRQAQYNEQYYEGNLYCPRKGYVAVVFHDITQDVLSHREINSIRKRNQFVIEGTNAGTWDWDVQTGKQVLNNRWAEIIGYSLNELKPTSLKTWEESLHPEDIRIAEVEIGKLLNKEIENYDVEFRQKHKEGHWVWIQSKGKVVEWSLSGEPIRVSGIHIDISKQKEAALELKEQEELFRLALEASNDGVWDWNLENDKVFWSKRYKEIIGFKDTEIEASLDALKDLVHVEDFNNVMSPVREFIKGKLPRYKVEFRMRHKKGHYVPIVANGYLLRDDNDKPYRIIGTHHDLTERYNSEKRLREQVDENLSLYEEYRTINEELHRKNNDLLATEEELKANNEELYLTNEQLGKSEERYRSLFDNMNNAFALYHVICDDKGKVIDYQPEDINGVYVQYVQKTKQEALNLKESELIPMNARLEDEWLELIEQVALQGISAKVVRHDPYDEHYYEANLFSPHKGYFAAIFKDVTSEVESYRQLEESKLRNDFILAGTNAGTWDWNIENQKFIVNKQFLNVLGLPEDKLVISEAEIRSSIHDDDLVKVDSELSKHLRGEAENYNIEFRVRHPKGYWVWVNSRGKVVQWSHDGKPVRMSGTQIDMTEKKHAEMKLHEKVIEYECLNEEYKKLNEELEHSKENLEELVLTRTSELVVAKEKAEMASKAKGDFIANMSHELRTPLNAILGYAHILQKDTNINNKQRKSLLTIHQSGQHLLDMINEILDYGKMDAKKLSIEAEVVNLSDVLQSVLEIIKIKAEEKQLYLNYEPAFNVNSLVKIDARRLKQILLNLLSNGVKYTNAGGVTLKINVIQQKTSMLELTVIDTGIGIKEEHAEKVFEPFTQNLKDKKFVEGTGLGLPITRELVLLMGGTIQLQQNKTEGSTFVVELPIKFISDYGIEKQSVAKANVIGYTGEKQSILIVDDNQANSSLLKDYLTPLGFNVQLSSNTNDAIGLNTKRSFDLIILDFMMPDKDGLDLLHELPAKRPKVLGVSATLTNADKRNVFENKCDAFLCKPIDLSVLLGKIEYLLPIELQYEHHEIIESIDFVLPDSNVLEAVKEYALLGDFNSIENILSEMDENKWSLFISKVNEAIAKYDDDTIIDLCTMSIS
ncbi:hybrid sensor histidine kinase/response regulator [Carboxylicivirga marina]|uniref:histidine kinase n=1 Tax=Carboxylicivirga marina TaxID=2800988 RepID=A0ABS1HGS6_9BACT|nr:hybrid sensor histidine kinase/response regulator [Carboxylicivirga marina]MBK3516878.1 PAS domain-containing protein [Carboxylicivirga marina]